jgi:hypothetical protein
MVCCWLTRTRGLKVKNKHYTVAIPQQQLNSTLLALACTMLGGQKRIKAANYSLRIPTQPSANQAFTL